MSVCVCMCAWKSMCILWPFVDSCCRVNAIMTSRDAICFPGSYVIQPLRGVKWSIWKQHQQLLKHFILTANLTDITVEFTLKQYELCLLWMSVSLFTCPFCPVHHSYCYWLLKSYFQTLKANRLKFLISLQLSVSPTSNTLTIRSNCSITPLHDDKYWHFVEPFDIPYRCWSFPMESVWDAQDFHLTIIFNA